MEAPGYPRRPQDTPQDAPGSRSKPQDGPESRRMPQESPYTLILPHKTHQATENTLFCRTNRTKRPKMLYFAAREKKSATNGPFSPAKVLKMSK